MMKMRAITRTQNINSNTRIVFNSLIFTTLIVGPNFNDPFNSAKLITLILFASVVLGKIIVNLRPINFGKFLIDWLLVLFILGMFISYIHTTPKVIGFFGDLQRKNGLLTYIALSVLFFYMTRSSSNFDKIRFSRYIFYLSYFFVFYGSLQLIGQDIFKWVNPYNPIILTLGNPNFASALMGILAIYIVNLALNEKLLIKKIHSFFVVCLLIFLMYESDSRQGLILLVVGGLAVSVIKLRITALKLGNTFILLYLALIVLAAFGMAKIGPLSEFMYKGSITVRGYYWRAGVKMFLENPLTGVGLDRYQYFFKEYREQGYALNFGYNITSSNAHNVVIQLFATGGLIVGIAYVSIIFYILIEMIKNLRKISGENSYIVGIFGMWIGFQSQSLISIDNIGISIWGWVLSGILVNHILRSKNSDIYWDTIQKKFMGNYLNSMIASCIFFLMTLILASWIYVAETNALKSRAAFNSKSSSNSIQNIQSLGLKVMNSKFIDPNYQIEVSRNFISVGLYSEATQILEKIVAQDHRNQEALDNLAYIYESTKQYDKSMLIRKQIFKLDPYGIPNLLSLGINYKNLLRYKEMNEVKDLIINLVPNSLYSDEANKYLIE